MQTPLQITFRHMDHSPAVEARARELTDWLERFHERIIGCRVTIEGPTAHHRNGAPFDIRIDLTIPDEEVVVCSNHSGGKAHGDVYSALRDAFDNAHRRLQGAERTN
jgi:hypothetical protein